MVSDFIIGSIITIGGVGIAILASIIGWLVKKILDMKKDINRISTSYEGTVAESGHLQETRGQFESLHQRLDDMEDLVCNIERRRKEEHDQVVDYLVDIVDVLREEEINGGLPDLEFDE